MLITVMKGIPVDKVHPCILRTYSVVVEALKCALQVSWENL